MTTQTTMVRRGGFEVETEDEAFLALLCEDPELLRAEFDEIVAAAWGSEPPVRRWFASPTPGRGDDLAGKVSLSLVAWSRHSGANGRACQRSPPAPSDTGKVAG